MNEGSVPRLLFTRAAKMDIKNAERWYEARSAGLGDRFLAAVETVTERLRAFPESCPRVHPRIRRAIVPGFPYGVFYVNEAERIRVIAVMHWRQHPAHWQARIP